MISNYGCSDVFFQIVRLILLGALIVLPILFIETKSKGAKSLLIAGSILVGNLVYFIIMYLFELVMWYTAGYEALGVFDTVFLFDDEKNYSNFVGCIIFEKFEFEEMRDYLFSKLEKIHKCKSKLVKKFGIYWFKDMSGEEWATKK